MLSLRDQIRGDPLGVSAPAHQHQFRRPGNEIDSALARHEFFCGSDVAVSRSHNLVNAGDGLRSEGESGDGLGAAQTIDIP